MGMKQLINKLINILNYYKKKKKKTFYFVVDKNSNINKNLYIII
jgi:hypothetical protein